MSRVTCASQLGQAWQLRTPYEQHRTLWRLFADQDGRDFLFREQIPKRRAAGSPRQFIVVSTRRPRAAPGFTIETRDYAPRLAAGDVLCFSARLSVTAARPVERPSAPGAPLVGRGKSVDPIAEALATVSGAEDRRALRRRWLIGEMANRTSARNAPLLVSHWLAPKLLRHGFEVVPAATHVATYEPAMHQGRKSKDSITFSVAEFNGVVNVVDATPATVAAFSGVGRGKSLGYGLLLFSRREPMDANSRGEIQTDDGEEEEVPARA